MDLNTLTNKFEEFNNKFDSDNIKDLNNLDNEIFDFLSKYKSISRDIKFKKVFKKINQLLPKLYEKKLDLKSKLKKSNKYHVSTDNDYYYDDNMSDNYIEGTNYVIYGSDLDPLEPEQDLLDFCN